MHIKKLTNGGWLGRARIGNYNCIVDGDTLQECIDKMFEMMMKDEANGTIGENDGKKNNDIKFYMWKAKLRRGGRS